MGSSFVYCLQMYNIKYNDLDIIVDGKLKHTGPKNKLKLDKIEIDFQISLKDDQSNENLVLCEKLFKENCPISDILIQGIPYEFKISKKK